MLYNFSFCISFWTQQTPIVEINPAGQFPSTFSIWINFNPFSFFHCSFLLQNQIQFHLGTFWFQSFDFNSYSSTFLLVLIFPLQCQPRHFWKQCRFLSMLIYNIFICVTSNRLLLFIFQYWIKTWKILVPARATLRLQLFNYLSQTKVSTATINKCTYM